MARKLFVLAVFLVAGSIGVVGFQVLDYLIGGTWPAVPLQVFGVLPGAQWLPSGPVWRWLGGVPVSLAGMIVGYFVFLASDTLRQR